MNAAAMGVCGSGSRHCLVITGGSLEARFAAAYYQCYDWDLVIAADAGLRVCHAAGIVPDQIVGDFDSLSSSGVSEKTTVTESVPLCGETAVYETTCVSESSAASEKPAVPERPVAAGRPAVSERMAVTETLAALESGDRGKDETSAEAPLQSKAKELLDMYAAQGISIRRFKPEKDLTDTQIAVELAIELAHTSVRMTSSQHDAASQDDAGEQNDSGCLYIHVLGGTGTRLDHVLGNLQVMELALRKGARMLLVDPCNRIRMIDVPLRIRRNEQWGDFISLVPWAGKVAGLTLRGFKYPLSNATLLTGESLGISNELTEAEGEITFEDGLLLVIESRDRAATEQ